MNWFFFIAYEIALWVAAICLIPKTLYALFVHKKYKESLAMRLGLCKQPLNLSTEPSIWIHAVSVGETKAVVSVARAIKKQFPRAPLIISSITETGHAEAKRSLPFADAHLYLPFDFTFCVRSIIKKANPKLVILCESDFWHNFLYYAKKNGASIALVNGKISHKSMRRFSFFAFFSKKLFSLFDIFCLQNTLYEQRFIKAGAPSEKLVVTGNLKLDEEYPRLPKEEEIEWRKKLGFAKKDLILTAGSTHAPEEALIIKTLKQLIPDHPNVKLILVPRHPDRFKEVAQLIEDEKISWIPFSDIQHRTGAESVILIDTMGLLRMCYQLSDIAIVGGSFTKKVGGHNILEPCSYGKPVLFGPHMHTQLEFVDFMIQYGAGKQISEEKLLESLVDWLTHPIKRAEVGSEGLRLMRDLKGSTHKTMEALEGVYKSSHRGVTVQGG